MSTTHTTSENTVSDILAEVRTWSCAEPLQQEEWPSMKRKLAKCVRMLDLRLSPKKKQKTRAALAETPPSSPDSAASELDFTEANDHHYDVDVSLAPDIRASWNEMSSFCKDLSQKDKDRGFLHLLIQDAEFNYAHAGNDLPSTELDCTQRSRVTDVNTIVVEAFDDGLVGRASVPEWTNPIRFTIPQSGSTSEWAHALDEQISSYVDLEVNHILFEADNEDTRCAIGVTHPPLQCGQSLHQTAGRRYGLHLPLLHVSFQGSLDATTQPMAGLSVVHMLHAGAPRILVVIRPQHAHKFAGILSSPLGSCSQAVSHLQVIPKLRTLIDAGIDFSIIVQKPGQVVVLTGDAIHYGFNLGATCVEIIHMALNNWQIPATLKFCEDRCGESMICHGDLDSGGSLFISPAASPVLISACSEPDHGAASVGGDLIDCLYPTPESACEEFHNPSSPLPQTVSMACRSEDLFESSLQASATEAGISGAQLEAIISMWRSRPSNLDASYAMRAIQLICEVASPPIIKALRDAAATSHDLSRAETLQGNSLLNRLVHGCLLAEDLGKTRSIVNTFEHRKLLVQMWRDFKEFALQTAQDITVGLSITDDSNIESLRSYQEVEIKARNACTSAVWKSVKANLKAGRILNQILGPLDISTLLLFPGCLDNPPILNIAGDSPFHGNDMLKRRFSRAQRLYQFRASNVIGKDTILFIAHHLCMVHPFLAKVHMNSIRKSLELPLLCDTPFLHCSDAQIDDAWRSGSIHHLFDPSQNRNIEEAAHA